MASILPPFPRFVMTVFEPLSLIAGALAPFIAPEWFIAEQIPGSSIDIITSNAQIVAAQLGNMYLLMAMVGIAVLQTTAEPKVVRNYVVALWLADIGHVAVTCYLMDRARLVDIGHWNALTWGNIGATMGLFLTRTLYLLGVFGPAIPSSSSARPKYL